MKDISIWIQGDEKDKQNAIVRIMQARLGKNFKNYNDFLKYVQRLRTKCNV